MPPSAGTTANTDPTASGALHAPSWASPPARASVETVNDRPSAWTNMSFSSAAPAGREPAGITNTPVAAVTSPVSAPTNGDNRPAGPSGSARGPIGSPVAAARAVDEPRRRVPDGRSRGRPRDRARKGRATVPAIHGPLRCSPDGWLVGPPPHDLCAEARCATSSRAPTRRASAAGGHGPVQRSMTLSAPSGCGRAASAIEPATPYPRNRSLKHHGRPFTVQEHHAPQGPPGRGQGEAVHAAAA